MIFKKENNSKNILIISSIVVFGIVIFKSCKLICFDKNKNKDYIESL